MCSQRASGPVLILVSGPPASGKSYLARQLSKRLGVPAIHKDALKETLFDTLGTGDREWSRRLGAASWAILFDLVDGQLAAGRTIIAESNFYPEDRQRIQELQAQHGTRVVEVNCTAPPEMLRSRYLERSRAKDCHIGHGDDEALAARASHLAGQGLFSPKDACDDAIVVDTADFGRMDYAEIASRIRSSILTR